MKTSELLIEAKKYLDRENLDGVCNALAGARAARLRQVVKDEQREPLRKVAEALYMHIEGQLAGFNYASTWLAAQMLHPERTKVVTQRDCELSVSQLWVWVKEQGPKAIQTWRLAWMDKMIAEFQAKGD